MATVQAYTKSGVDAKFNARSNMTMVHNGGGSPDLSAYPDSKTGDVIERSSDGARWSVVASTINPIEGRVVSVAGKTGVVTLTPGNVGAAPASHTHTKANITDLNASTSATANSIAQRGSGGVLVVGTPTATTHAATKSYVDSRITGGITWGNLSGKPSTFTPSSHNHTVAQITDLPTVSTSIVNSGIVRRTAAGQVPVPTTPAGSQDAASKSYVDSTVTSGVTWSKLSGKPSTFAPSTHSHTQAQVTGLPAKLTTYDNSVSKVNSAVSSVSGSTSDSGKLLVLTSTGRLGAVNPTGENDVANKQYVDSEIAAKTTWANTSGKPSTFPPSSHTHTVAQISNLTLSQTATGSSVVQRDSSGRATVSTPTATGHATTKAYVDNAVTAGKAWSAITGKPSTFTPSSHTHTMSQITDLPEVTTSVKNHTIVKRSLNSQVPVPSTPVAAQDATSKVYVDNAISSHTHTMSQITDLPVLAATSTTANSIVQRKSDRNILVPLNPDADQDATSKKYVDDYFKPTFLGSQNLNDMITTGLYIQGLSADATTDRNYPPGARAGFLEISGGSVYTKQEYTDYRSASKYHRAKYSSNWYPWQLISQTEA